MKLFLGNTGRELEIGQLIGRGGEGSVYEVRHSPGRAVKIYAKPLDQLRVEKLSVMPALASPELLAVAAWPEQEVYNDRGSIVGFVMPRFISAKDIHELYSPKSRLALFPSADFRFIVHVASNIARAFAVVHKYGHVIGDVNHGSILICGNGTVKLIDCDSFQVKERNRILPCVVGSPLFTPPEIQNRHFNATARTQEHDLFGLAVVLFQLLFMGRHPFAGRYKGQGDMPIERAIAERRFPYGPSALSRQMERPPGTLSMDSLGAVVQQCFLDAFENSGPRPNAIIWINALQALQRDLTSCSLAPSHQYPKGMAKCPWCSFEDDFGVPLFGVRNLPNSTYAPIDVTQLWNDIAAVPEPGAPPMLSYDPNGPKKAIQPSLLNYVIRNSAAIAGGVFLFSLLVLHGIGLRGIQFFVSAGASLVVCVLAGRRRVSTNTAMEQRRLDAKGRWGVVYQQWQGCTSYRFDHARSALIRAKLEIDSLPDERARRIKDLESRQKDIQLDAYLSRFRIDKAKIANIGASRTTTLASYGVETAADIVHSKIHAIPGFGSAMYGALMNWRNGHAANFRYVPTTRIDPQELAKIDRDMMLKQQQLVATLKQGVSSLRNLAEEIRLERSRLKTQLDLTWREWEASVNAKA